MSNEPWKFLVYTVVTSVCFPPQVRSQATPLLQPWRSTTDPNTDLQAIWITLLHHLDIGILLP